jgi:hypothetical protein
MSKAALFAHGDPAVLYIVVHPLAKVGAAYRETCAVDPQVLQANAVDIIHADPTKAKGHARGVSESGFAEGDEDGGGFGFFVHVVVVLAGEGAYLHWKKRKKKCK